MTGARRTGRQKERTGKAVDTIATPVVGTMGSGKRMAGASVLLLIGALAAAVPGAAPAAGFAVAKPALKSERYTELARDYTRDDPLQALAGELNAVLKLPVPVRLRYAECGEANAFYEPAERRITLCFELVEQIAEDFGAQLDDDAELADAVNGAVRFIVLHEVGHALVDVLKVPVTGREEDAVDQLSAWLLIGDEAGDNAVLSAAAAFSLNGQARGDAGEGDFAGEHSLDEQRYFSMVCWVYGRDPQRHADLVEASGLPAARAAGCVEEYTRLDASWRRLLQPQLKR
jgi:hypothetical protein